MSDYATNTSVNLMINGQQAAETLANLKKHALDLSEQIAKAAAAGDKLQTHPAKTPERTPGHQSSD